jgi:hypothetical protein
MIIYVYSSFNYLKLHFFFFFNFMRTSSLYKNMKISVFGFFHVILQTNTLGLCPLLVVICDVIYIWCHGHVTGCYFEEEFRVEDCVRHFVNNLLILGLFNDALLTTYSPFAETRQRKQSKSRFATADSKEWTKRADISVYSLHSDGR